MVWKNKNDRCVLFKVRLRLINYSDSVYSNNGHTKLIKP